MNEAAQANCSELIFSLAGFLLDLLSSALLQAWEGYYYNQTSLGIFPPLTVIALRYFGNLRLFLHPHTWNEYLFLL